MVLEHKYLLRQETQKFQRIPLLSIHRIKRACSSPTGHRFCQPTYNTPRAKMPVELRKRKEKAAPAKVEDMPPAKKAAQAAPAPKRKGELI